MSYYDNYKKIVEVGGDDDLASCLQYNEQPFGVDDIKQVLAVWDGEHDGDHYRWILEMKDGRYMYLNGWCDYTGWDCQSEAYSLGPFLCGGRRRSARKPSTCAKTSCDR
jgi:hypothetical protein